MELYQKKHDNLKRKRDEQAQTPPKMTSTDLNIAIKPLDQQSKKGKLTPTQSNQLLIPQNSAIPFRITSIPASNPLNCSKIAWIQWKNNSCRIDAFATVAYMLFFHELKDATFPILNGPSLPNEIHPLGVLLKGIDESLTIAQIQKHIDGFVSYRSRGFKEKAGSGAPISSLFAQLKDLPPFTWSFTSAIACDSCNHASVRTFDSEPFFTISTSSLTNSGGFCTEAIKLSLEDYVTECLIDKTVIKVHKTITKVPNYYCCVLEYAEDLSRGFVKADKLPPITIEDNFITGSLKMTLVAIVYFQGLHYTVHTYGCQHPKLMPIREENGSITMGLDKAIIKGVSQKEFFLRVAPNLYSRVKKIF
jgi:hypothetical protein